jgi:hypothetical protein
MGDDMYMITTTSDVFPIRGICPRCGGTMELRPAGPVPDDLRNVLNASAIVVAQPTLEEGDRLT